ncbi:GTP cyclohydrolase II [Arachnomyces sp. PD_36]|nr:GTP cyclohydrolase II [Arachnomyces sp. PD_36]
MPDLPSHVSPTLSPQPINPDSKQDRANRSPASTIDGYPESSGNEAVNTPARHQYDSDGVATPALPDSILSPAFTPPATPGNQTPSLQQTHTSQPIDLRHQATHKKPPNLLPRLPNVECVVRARIPTTTGAEMFLHLYKNDADEKEHLAIVFGNTIRSRSLDSVREGETEMDRMIRGAYVGRLRPGRLSSRVDEEDKSQSGGKGGAVADAGDRLVEEALKANGTAPVKETQTPLVRIHSECYTGETAWSARCDCGEQLDEAARLMSLQPPQQQSSDSEHSSQNCSPGGVIIYLRQEGRGIGLSEKLKAYNLQDLGSDTVEANLLLRHPADARSYGLATAMLVDLGLGVDSSNGGISLLTNNPDKVRAVEGPNREVVVKERVPMIPLAWRTGGKKGIRSSEIEGYLRTKASLFINQHSFCRCISALGLDTILLLLEYWLANKYHPSFPDSFFYDLASRAFYSPRTRKSPRSSSPNTVARVFKVISITTHTKDIPRSM